VAQYGSYYAIKYIDPVWSGVTNVVNASESLVNDFVSLAAQVPGVGRRLAEVDPVSGRAIMLRQLQADDVALMPPHVVDAGLAAARSLQQAGDLTNTLGGLLNGLAGTLGSVPTGQINNAVGSLSQNLAQLPGLSQILPNGANNPLFQTLSGVTQAVESQVLNRTGCPIYCVDLRDQSWIQDGCMCNLQRLKDAYPHWAPVWTNIIPAIILVFLMMVASTWLLLHAASQWARTRSEVKLLQRLPCAAQLASRGAIGQQHQGANGLPVSGVYQQPLPAV
jgi:hypothetical protein